jgi:hypothetical protein
LMWDRWQKGLCRVSHEGVMDRNVLQVIGDRVISAGKAMLRLPA